ncbi:MAG: redoxin domain-containing protein [Verrucomicrobiales bacterium]|nr:redoxin domain-containing protein [Verrucomicrobiales bacterium]
MESEQPLTSIAGRPSTQHRSWRLLGLVGILAVCLLGLVFKEPITARLMQKPTLANDAPPASVIEEMIANHPSPASAIVAAWSTDKIVHRAVAIQQIGRSIPRSQPLAPELEAILLAGTLDPDQNVCEASFSTLNARSHPDLARLATRQLGNSDPEIRRLALDILRRNESLSAVPSIARLLDDPQQDIAALAIHTLGRFARRDFGIKLSDAVAVDNETSGLKEFKPGSLEKIREAASVAKAWLRENPQVAPDHPVDLPEAVKSARRRIPAPDFALKALDGTKWPLSALRGKVVLINFWATWCTACVGELPVLTQLRQRHGPELVILGVSLDGLADSHGHVGGHGDEGQSGVEGHSSEDGHDHHDAEDVPSLKDIQRKVQSAVQRRGINYPVLIDASNDVGSRYNGGELPTTVLVDKEGFVRRRFVGPRSIEVFEAMIREASQSDAAL